MTGPSLPQRSSSEFDAAPRSLSGALMDGQLQSDWYVFWWRRDGTAYGLRGMDLALSQATRLAADIREGRETP